MIRKLVREDYVECIKMMPDIPQDLRDSLRLHERVPAFVDNLARELDAAEKHGVNFDRMTIKQAVYDMTHMFVRAVKLKAEQQIKPHLYQKPADISEQLDESGNGTIEELGITIRDRESDIGETFKV